MARSRRRGAEVLFKSFCTANNTGVARGTTAHLVRLLDGRRHGKLQQEDQQEGWRADGAGQGHHPRRDARMEEKAENVQVDYQ